MPFAFLAIHFAYTPHLCLVKAEILGNLDSLSIDERVTFPS